MSNRYSSNTYSSNRHTLARYVMPASKMGLFEIIDNLYQSGSPESFQDWVEVWKRVDTAVSLWTECEPFVPDGKMLIRWEIEDGPLPNKTKLHMIAEFISVLLDTGGTILVQCGAGCNRSGLITALVVRRRMHVNGVAAMRLVQRKCPGALTNLAFNQYLSSLQAPKS